MTHTHWQTDRHTKDIDFSKSAHRDLILRSPKKALFIFTFSGTLFRAFLKVFSTTSFEALVPIIISSLRFHSDTQVGCLVTASSKTVSTCPISPRSNRSFTCKISNYLSVKHLNVKCNMCFVPCNIYDDLVPNVIYM